jgi:hypothetical protein
MRAVAAVVSPEGRVFERPGNRPVLNLSVQCFMRNCEDRVPEVRCQIVGQTGNMIPIGKIRLPLARDRNGQCNRD